MTIFAYATKVEFSATFSIMFYTFARVDSDLQWCVYILISNNIKCGIKFDLCKYNGNNYRYSIFIYRTVIIFAEDIVDVAPDHEESNQSNLAD